MKTSKVLLGLVLFSILGFLFLYMAGFFTEKLPEKRLIQQSDYPDMKVEQLNAQPQVIRREYAGTVVADQETLLAARLTAKVAEVLVDVGDQVRQGDILMRLESRDLDARVKQTEQRLSSAQAQLNMARKEYKRVKELADKNLLSQSQLDRTESELKTAQAAFRQTEAAVVEAETTFGFSMITAPFDGVIMQRAVNKGDTATPGMHLLKMYNPATLQLESNVSEAQISQVTLGSQLGFHLPSYQVSGRGDVVEISPAADTNSRSFVVKVALGSDKLIYPGSYGKLIIEQEGTTLLTVPPQAVYQVGQLDYVKVIEEGVLKTRLVQLGENNRVRKGLASGETVVLEPLKY